MMDETIFDDVNKPPGHVPSEIMSLALDGMLEPDEHQWFETHLSACEVCTGEWLKWRRISNALQAEAFVAPAPGFMLRVDQSIRSDETRRERLWGGVVLVGGTLAIWTLLLMGLALVLGVGTTLFPEMRLGLLEYFGFSGQALALIWRNLGTLRDGLLALLPGPAMMVAVAVVLAVLTLIWLRLARSTGRRSVTSGRQPSTHNTL
jgi:hypothetical protein